MSGVLWLLPLLPACLAGVLLCAGRRADRTAGALAVLAAAAVLVLAVAAWAGRPVTALPWLPIGDGALSLHLSAAGTNAPMAALVAAMTVLVLVYSIGYIGRSARFFGLMSLFLGAMLLLVLADDLLTLLIGWELVGACSYGLIGFWYREPQRGIAALRAFVTTRTADLGLYVAAMAAFAGSGGFTLDSLATLPAGYRDLVMLGLIAAAAGKSAQLPFSGWLSGAMEGPSPVSALLHSATMVAAGVVLLLKIQPLIHAVHWAAPVIVWLGVASMLVGGVIAYHHDGLKQRLAASTVSQYGYLFAAAGSGSVLATAGYLLNHAVFKALLFLAAGVLVHQGLTRNGRTRRLAVRMPRTLMLYAVGALGLAALPPSGGFFAKTSLLAAVEHFDKSAYWVLLAGGALTAAYATRAWLEAFFLPTHHAPSATRAHDPAALMRRPMGVLATLVIVLALLALPPVQTAWAAALGTSATPHPGLFAIAVELAIVLAGVAWALRWHRRARRRPDTQPALQQAARGWLGLVGALDGCAVGVLRIGQAAAAPLDSRPISQWVTALPLRGIASLASMPIAVAGRIPAAVRRYARAVAGLPRVAAVNTVRALAGTLARVDHTGVDRLAVGMTTTATLHTALASRTSDRRVIDGALRTLTRGLQHAACALSRRQSGLLHDYYAQLAMGVAGLFVLAIVLLGV